MHLSSDSLEPARAVVHGVHRRCHREQRLRGTDVGGRALATNMLLTGLQCQAVGRSALRVLRHTHQAARQLALHLLLDRHVRGVRATVEQRNAEALRGTNRDIRAKLTRGLQQRQCENIRIHRDQAPALVHRLDHHARINHVALGAGVGHDGTHEALSHDPLTQVNDLHLEVKRASTLRCDPQDLRVQARIQQHRPTLAHCASHQADSLRSRRSLIQQGSVRNVQAGQVLHHSLEVQQCLKTTLRNLRLIRRIRRVPPSILDHTAPNYRRRQRRRVPLAVERLEHLIFRRQLPQPILRLVFRERGRKVERPLK